MDISQVSGSSPSGSTQAKRETLGKDDFLKLLMAQLSKQDPLSPMDSQAFVAQLAQFANVEQLQAQSQRLDALVLAQTSANQLQSTSLVGKEAVFRSDSVEWNGSKSVDLSGQVSEHADVVTVTIRDAKGTAVRTIQMADQAAGPFSLVWDGRDNSGKSVPAGRYGVSVVAANVNGQNVPADSWGRGRIRGVSFESGFAEVLLGNGRALKLSDVLQVSETST